MSIFNDSTGPDKNKEPIPAEEDAIMERLAKKVVEWRMAVPAILFLESVRPLNYIGSQTMVFFEPIIQTIFNFADYDTLRAAMERRENVENLLQKIEKHDAILDQRERAIKKFMKVQKKDWKWYQRYFGIARPKVRLPEELSKPLFPKEKKK